MLQFASPKQRLQLVCRRGDEAAARAVLRQHPRLIDEMMPQDHRAIADAAWSGDARAVSLMLKLGFDPRATGHESGTALHLAAWEGSAAVVRQLLSHPAARELVEIKDAHYNATPLGWCCHGSLHGNPAHEHAQCAQLLLDAGARPGPDAQHASPAVQTLLAGAAIR
jgi:ankyrin repeat protein